jgi:hypothetical protein
MGASPFPVHHASCHSYNYLVIFYVIDLFTFRGKLSFHVFVYFTFYLRLIMVICMGKGYKIDGYQT